MPRHRFRTTMPRSISFSSVSKWIKRNAVSRSRLIALLLAFITLLVFLPVGRFGFVNFDDTDYVTQNSFVKHGLTATGIQWALTTFHAGNWHPLTWISHMADCELFGLNAGAHHFVNVLFHATNSALLFVLLWRLTKKIWSATLIAALFAWHPLHVESVAWISERKDVLSTFFALLALLNYARWAMSAPWTDGRKSFGLRLASPGYFLALFFFALSLLAKPMLVTLPFMLLLLDYWPLKRLSGDKWHVTEVLRLATEKIPFFLLSAISCIITLLAQREAIVPLTQVSFGYRLENAPVAVVSYLGKLFWPVNLCAFYPMPEKIPALQVVLSTTLLIMISAIAWQWRKMKPYFLIGWLWFLGTLVPVIGLVQVGGQAMADRYAYIPSIGFFIALVFSANEFAARIQTPGVIRYALAGLVSVACILVTENQLAFWRDSEALFRRAAAVTQNNDIVLVNLGVALDAQGRFEEALDVYHQAERLGSRRYQVYNNLGNVLAILGRPAESLAEYHKAIQLAPDNAALHNAVGSQLAKLERFAEAANEFQEAARLNPNYALPHIENAKLLFKSGHDIEALDEFRAALRIDPGNYQTLATVAHYLAANENAAARDGKNALLLAHKANDLSGHVQPLVLDILGMAFAETGDFTNAVACARQAQELAQMAKLKDLEAIQLRLELYKKGQPWRESFRATNAPGKFKFPI
jgi:tetratricopeptide (TPR) repeat protein